MKGSLVLEKIEAGIKAGSAQIAQEIEGNVEKYGVAPVIVVDGKLKNLKAKIIDIAQLKDSLKLLKKHGYSEDDFYLLEDKKAKYRGKAEDKSVLLQGCIICVCKKSGKIKEYHANGGSSWIEDLAQDLQNKFFTN